MASSSDTASISAKPNAALIDIAEEFGRLLARRELALTKRRRGYSLIELVLGATIAAVVWISVSRWLGWLPR